jgi:Concanavalin A-like lectin/glucanases superfamily/Immunoglobulin I-set domain
MNNNPVNRSLHTARWLVSAVRFNLALLLLALLATTGQAQIAIQDGNPLTYTYAGSAAINKSVIVTAGASVLVVLVEDRSVNNAEPATINWIGGQVLTRDVQASGIPSTTRGLAMYHLFNPTPGTNTITGTVTGSSGTWVTAYTLSGVDTTIAPIIAGATSGGTSTTTTALNINVIGVPVGAWAAVNACWGNTPSTSAYINVTNQAGVAINSTTAVDGADNATTAAAGYVSSLTAGTNNFTAGYTTGGKFVFAVEVFSPPSAPNINVQPASAIIFTNGTAKFSVTAIGSAPLSYQWFTNNITFPLSNGGNLTGTTSNVLQISNAALANVGSYFVVVTNSLGAATSSVASLSFIPLSGAYEAAVLTNNPFAYYSFSETNNPASGTVVAYDSVGSFNGTYGVASSNAFNGIAGPRATADGLIGFPDSNTALDTVSNTTTSLVTLPAWNLNTNGWTGTTLAAWINPSGPQANGGGIVMTRATGNTCGINYLNPTNASGNHILGYSWNNDATNTWGWNSGLVPPLNQWSLVVLVVTPTNATMYLATTNGVATAVNAIPHVPMLFNGTTMIGLGNATAAGTAFNGGIDEVAAFGQALTQSQVLNLFTAASGITSFPPTIAANPAWTPSSIYVGQSSTITVNAGGSTPLTYQWMAGAVGSGIYTNLVNGGSTSGATNAALTITNAQVANDLDYVVVITNVYGAITSAPATLTVTPTGPPTTFTLNYNAAFIVQAAGADWNTANQWNPLGLSATTSLIANPGSSFEIVVQSLMRNPAGSVNNTFPNASLQLDGNGNTDFNPNPAATGEIRFKNGTPGIGSTNFFSNLVLNGGELNIGDSTDIILKGKITVLTNSVFGTQGGTGTNQTYRVDSYLTGSGTIVLYLSNTNALLVPPILPATLNITGTTNTFTGQWNILQGPLLGTGVNSLGTNTITIGANGILETTYPLNNPNGSLVVNGKMFLTQVDTFKSLYVNGVGIAPGTYSAFSLSTNYPGNFPATFAALNGSTSTTASGQITVLAFGPPLIGANPTWSPATIYVGQTSSITIAASGTPPLSYQWMAGAVGSGVYTNLVNGGGTSGATNATLTLTNAQLSNALDYIVVVSTANGSVTSSVPATLTVIDSSPFVVTSITPATATVYAGYAVTFTVTFNGSQPITYQWLADNNGDYNFVNIPGATNSTLVLSNLPAGLSGQDYYVLASNSAGSVPSSVAILTTVDPTYAIHFGTTNAITTADAVLNQPGVLTGAAVFGGTAEVVTLSNGSNVTFTANGSVATVTGANQGAFAYPAPATTGNANFDAVLNQCNFDSGPKTVTVNNLVAGHKYSVLLIGLDARGTVAGGGAPARFAYFQDPAASTDVSPTFQMGQNVYVMASFLAQTTTQNIIEQLPTGNAGNMNALVVYDVSAVVAVPTLSLARSGGSLTLTWSAGSTLLQATNVLGPWTTNTATSPYTVPTTNAQSFFRVRIP